jgi:hypothetical protein
MPPGPGGFFGQKKKEEPQELEELEFTLEQVRLAAWRIEMLIKGGFDTGWAGRIAAIPDLDWRRAVRLRKRGCSQANVEEILR